METEPHGVSKTIGNRQSLLWRAETEGSHYWRRSMDSENSCSGFETPPRGKRSETIPIVLFYLHSLGAVVSEGLGPVKKKPGKWFPFAGWGKGGGEESRTPLLPYSPTPLRRRRWEASRRSTRIVVHDKRMRRKRLRLAARAPREIL